MKIISNLACSALILFSSMSFAFDNENPHGTTGTSASDACVERNTEEPSILDEMILVGEFESGPCPLVARLEQKAKEILRADLDERHRALFYAAIVSPVTAYLTWCRQNPYDFNTTYWYLRNIIEYNFTIFKNCPEGAIKEFSIILTKLSLRDNLHLYIDRLVYDFYYRYEQTYWLYHSVFQDRIVKRFYTLL